MQETERPSRGSKKSGADPYLLEGNDPYNVAKHALTRLQLYCRLSVPEAAYETIFTNMMGRSVAREHRDKRSHRNSVGVMMEVSSISEATSPTGSFRAVLLRLQLTP